MGAESVDDGVQFAIIQFLTADGGPLFAFTGCAEDRLSSSVQSFFCMEPIEDLNGLGEQFSVGVPNPAGAIAHHHTTGSFSKPSPPAFPYAALAQPRPAL